MFVPERQAQILAYLQINRRTTVAELVALLEKSESTIRRDLQELAQADLLQRTHGGAVLASHAPYQLTRPEIGAGDNDAKARIGTVAAELVEDGDTVLLDAGTTTWQIAVQLRVRRITVVTNSLAVANELASGFSGPLVLLGGEMRPTTGAFVGPFAEQMLRQLHVDILFLGANGMDEGGVTTSNAAEAATKQAMVAAAKHVAVVSDGSTIGKTNFVHVCSWDSVHTLVTNERVKDEALARALRDNHVEVQTASSAGGEAVTVIDNCD